MQKTKQIEETTYFTVQDLLPIGMVFIVLGIGLAYGLSVMEDVKADQCTYSYSTTTNTCLNSSGGSGGDLGLTAAYNGSSSGIVAVAKIPSKLGLIVTVVLAAVIIGILVRYLFVRFN